MNILYIIPYVPSQIYVRPYNLIRELTANGHRLTILTITAREEDMNAIDHLKGFCYQVIAYPLPSWRSYLNCLLTLPTADPLQSAYCWQPHLKLNALELIKSNDFDIIHIEHLRGARYGLAIKDQMVRENDKIRSLPIIWDSVDCITHLFNQTARLGSLRINKLITSFELGRTANYEAKLINIFDHILVTSQNDRNAMLSLIDHKEDLPQISVLKNGVDLVYFVPNASIKRENETLVISGKMSYHANISMVMYLVNEIMPIVWSSKPTVQLWIVGKNPPQAITSLSANSLITVTGAVEDMRPYLQRSTISVAPLLYGAGIQNKVLEALACATPVITTPQGASALDISIGEEIIVADNPHSIANSIITIIENPQMREKLGKAGRSFVEKNHKWSEIAAKLESIYDETIYQKIRSS